MSEFHNPYHFVPVTTNRKNDIDAQSFPDKRGHVTHDRYCDGTYSGKIICRVTTETPIFIGSNCAKEAPVDNAKEIDPFELKSQPAIPASSLRGLISSIAESASNSALRVLEDAKYSYRRLMDTNQPEMFRPLSAIGMVVINKDAEGKTQYHLRPLTLPSMVFNDENIASLEDRWKGLFPTPNLKVYIGSGNNAIKEPSFHFETFSFERKKYYGIKLKSRNWVKGFPGEIARDNDMNIKNERYLVAQLPIEEGAPMRREFEPIEWDEIPEKDKVLYTRGILRVLGCNNRPDIPNTKKHELFIPYPEEAEKWETFPIQENAIERFYDLSDQRTEASKDNSTPLPYEPKGTQRNEDREKHGNKFRLKEGDLVWFRPTTTGDEIAEIAFSSVWRGRVETTNNKAATTYTFFNSIDSNLLPFNPERTVITLAEQLFGFAGISKDKNLKLPGALAGRVYFSHALFHGIKNAHTSAPESENNTAGKPYYEGVTLKILDSPKPPSSALYFKNAKNKPSYISKQMLKPGVHHPQGRKFYLHHRDHEVNHKEHEPWRSKHTGTTDKKSRLKQKVIIKPVRSGAVFYFHIDFDNLSNQEIGLLLYALKPTDEFRHKIGMGKPLGLGRINIEPVGCFRVNRKERYTEKALFGPRYDESWIEDGENQRLWPTEYERECVKADNIIDVTHLRDEFTKEMDPDIKYALELIGNPQAIKAPVLPPMMEDTDNEEETFAWFVENDKRAIRNIQSQKPGFLEPLTASSKIKKLPVLLSYQIYNKEGY